MRLYIKGIASLPCKAVAKYELDRLGLPYELSTLGEVDIQGTLTPDQYEVFKTTLQESGVELIDDKRSMLVEKIKVVVAEMVHEKEGLAKISFSNYLTQRLDHNYTYLANIFSEAMHTTIEQYLIAQKIERVKDLLVRDELSLTEISYLMNYSSVGHLSNQFKRVVGLTPSAFKEIEKKRQALLGNV